MNNPLRVVQGVLGSFADWIGRSNDEYFAYQRYGPDWREKLAVEAESRQLELERLRNLRDISGEELFQERGESLAKRSELAGGALSMADEETQNRALMSALRPDVDAILEPKDDAAFIGNKEIARGLAARTLEDENVRKAQELQELHRLQAATQASEALAGEREATEEQTRTLTPLRADSERALAEQRQASARTEGAEFDLTRARKVAADLEAEIKRVELDDKRFSTDEEKRKAIQSRAEALLGGDVGMRQRLVRIAEEVFVGMHPEQARALAKQREREGQQGLFADFRDVPTDVMKESLEVFRAELKNLGTREFLREDVVLPQSEGGGLEDSRDMEDEQEALASELSRYEERGVEPPEEFKRRIIEFQRKYGRQ